MKNLQSNNTKREVIRGHRVNRESIYYTALFGVALVTSIVLLIIGIVGKTKGLIIYTAILVPVFALADLAALRYTLVSKDTLYIEDSKLVIKSFFKTRVIPVSLIDKLTAATNNKNNVTTVNITYEKESVSYKFNDITKEDIARLRRATSKH